LVLLPGLDGTGVLFSSFCRALDPGITAIVASYPLRPDMGYAALEGVARSLLPRDRPFVLLAESFSGPIAISIAASRPAGLSGLILACSFARNPRPALAPVCPLLAFLPIHLAPAHALAWLTLGGFATPALKSQLAGILARVPPAVVKARLRAVLGVDVVSLLTEIDVPVLYLRASRDRLVPRSAAGILWAVQGLRVADVEGPHFLLQARPAAVAAVVEAFLHEIGLP
jgi:pimeloyl-ACP methyl ester carboxylesterase